MKDIEELYSLKEMKPCSKLQREWLEPEVLHKAAMAVPIREYGNDRLWVQLLDSNGDSITCVKSPSKRCYDVQRIGGKWYWKLTN